MRIVMEQSGHDLANSGDLAMLWAATDRFRKMFPNCTIHVVVNDERRLAQMQIPALPLPATGRQVALGTGRLVRGWERRLMNWHPLLALRLRRVRHRAAGKPTRDMDCFVQAIRDCDLAVAAGGGYFADAFPWMAVNVSAFLQLAQRLGKPTVMLGQGLGPLNDPGLRRSAMAAMKNLSLLCLREGLIGTGIAAELGVPRDRIHVTGDDTVELAYQSRRAEIGNHLGLNVRRAGYAGVGEEDSSPLRQALQKVIQDLGAPIQIAPISRAEGEDDWEQTLQLLPLESRRDLADLKQWQDVIPCVGRCRLMITGSYHAAVFALSQGIGAIGLVKSAYYRDKFRGLAHQFGPGCQLVDMETTDFPQRLATLARSLWDAAESNRGPLLAKAQEQIAQSRAAHQLMIRTIEKAA